MTGCIVCNLDAGYCEFCPTPVPLIDRDPGDENDYKPRATCRSYRATYSTPGAFRLSFRDFIGPDSHHAAVDMALAARDNTQTLISVKSLDDLDPVTVNHG